MTAPVAASKPAPPIGGSIPIVIGPWVGGLRNAGGSGEGIEDTELYEMINLELDVDRSLANRPAILEFATNSVPGGTDGIRVIGTFCPDDGRKLIVVTAHDTVFIINPTDGNAVTLRSVRCKAVVQYDNKLWIIPQIPGTGGYFGVPTSTTFSWVDVPTMPAGDMGVIYKDRLFIVSGSASSSNPHSRVWYSAILDPTSWPGINNFDVVPGNGQFATAMIVTATDIVIFKEHQTWKFGYGSDVAKASLDLVDAKIGSPNSNCAVQWNNNTIYVLHDNAVYELYNGTYTRISDNLAMDRTIDSTLFTDCQYGLTIYRDRLFVRFYAKQYVMNLKLQKWCEWQTARKFSKLVVIPDTNLGLDTAYASSATNQYAGKMFFFTDDRIDRVGIAVTGEIFDCFMRTKLYDFAVPTYYKRIHFGGLQIATSSSTTVDAVIPSVTIYPTWDQWEATYTWDSIEAAGVKWDFDSDVVVSSVTRPPGSTFGRRVLKVLKKFRFRQVQFKVTVPALTNTETNASVRIFDLTVHLAQAETIVKASS